MFLPCLPKRTIVQKVGKPCRGVLYMERGAQTTPRGREEGATIARVVKKEIVEKRVCDVIKREKEEPLD